MREDTTEKIRTEMPDIVGTSTPGSDVRDVNFDLAEKLPDNGNKLNSLPLFSKIVKQIFLKSNFKKT